MGEQQLNDLQKRQQSIIEDFIVKNSDTDFKSLAKENGIDIDDIWKEEQKNELYKFVGLLSRKLAGGDSTLSPKAKENFMKDFTSFDDLLKTAHNKFGSRLNIVPTPVVTDFEKDVFAFKCNITITATDKEPSQMVCAHGDATSANVPNKNIQIHSFRMAETRAVARALRFLLGETTAQEEVAEEEWYCSQKTPEREEGRE